MTLEERIESEYKSSLKARDAVKVSTLRMLKSAINNLRLEGSKKELFEADIVKILQRQIKQHKDSIGHFEKGKRDDLAEKEKKELAILLGYLPEQLSEDALKKIIDETIKALEATEKKDMGKVIKAVMEKVKGKAEGKVVSRVVSEMLK